ncbi:cuticle-degrading protease-like protein, partial [Leptotrombidium deliense]
LVVAAAGNEADDACLTSPGGSEYAFTVAASDPSNALASFSNYGECCNIIAPGVDCKLAVAGTQEFDRWSGTSMATPLVAGWAAVIEGKKRFNNPKKLADYMDSFSLKNVFSDELLQNTPNKFINVDCPSKCWFGNV